MSFKFKFKIGGNTDPIEINNDVNLKKNKKTEKILKKKITKKPFPFSMQKPLSSIINSYNNAKDINSDFNVKTDSNGKFIYTYNTPLSNTSNNWDLKWVKFDNSLEFSQDIYIRKWVRLSDPIVKIKPDQKQIPSKKEEQKYYKCKFDECGKIFSDSMSLKKHLAAHGEKQFICPVEGCGKKFLDKSKLRRHNLVHSGEKAYKCEICGKRFSLDFNLKTHLRTHTGLKPYICRFAGCGKKFTQSSNLVAHEKVHGKDGEEKILKKRGPNFKNREDGNNLINSNPEGKSKRGRKRKIDLINLETIDTKYEQPNKSDFYGLKDIEDEDGLQLDIN